MPSLQILKSLFIRDKFRSKNKNRKNRPTAEEVCREELCKDIEYRQDIFPTGR